MTADPYASIAELYDFAYGDYTEDITFYENLARIVDGPLLELGAGTGRVALALAADGYEVVGLDSSPSMLAVARRRLTATKPRGRLELVEGDMRRFDLGRAFALVFIAANTFQHMLTRREQQACLQCAAQHLLPGGIFAMAVRSPVSVDWQEPGAPSPLLLDWTRVEPESGDIIMKMTAAESDPGRMVRRLTYVYDRLHAGTVKRSVFVTELRYSTATEIELLLQQAGLRVTHVYGDYDLSPAGAGDSLIFVARAEGPSR